MLAPLGTPPLARRPQSFALHAARHMERGRPYAPRPPPALRARSRHVRPAAFPPRTRHEIMELSGDDEEGVISMDGLKHCTALHMAARRGNILVAEALLDCKANIEARDKPGDTPLRRAVNCGKTEMVAFLLSRGADAHAKGSRGLAPWQAARGAAMKKLLQVYSQ